MLLRRVIEHVKAQNWTAVVLDFVIVVMGVFIGIQVANWNAVRQERSLEQNYWQRLQRFTGRHPNIRQTNCDFQSQSKYNKGIARRTA